MNFISYETLLFTNLADEKTAILSPEKTCRLDGVNVSNATSANIRINLQIIRLLTTPIVESYLIRNVLIQPNQSLNLLSLGKLEVFLENGDNLLCFSNGYTELFDCTICYSIFNET